MSSLFIANSNHSTVPVMIILSAEVLCYAYEFLEMPAPLSNLKYMIALSVDKHSNKLPSKPSRNSNHGAESAATTHNYGKLSPRINNTNLLHHYLLHFHTPIENNWEY